MKCDACMHFAVMQLIPLFIKLVQQVICGRIPLAISVLQGTHLHLSEAKHMRVKRPAQGQNIESMSQRCVAKHENVHQVGIKPTQQAAAIAKRHALTIAPRPYLPVVEVNMTNASPGPVVYWHDGSMSPVADIDPLTRSRPCGLLRDFKRHV